MKLDNPQVVRPGDARGDADIRFAERLARLLDTYYLDPLLGLIPGVGDLLGTLLGCLVVAVAIRRKLPRVVVARMLLNLGVDGLVGIIPVVGDLFDVFHRGNLKNVALLRQRSHTHAAAPGDWLFVSAAAALFVAALVAPLLAVAWLGKWLLAHSG